MTLATCAKDVKFYRWPNINYIGVYETPVDCMSVKHISWNSEGNELVVVKSKGNPVIITAPSKPDEYIDSFNLNINHVSVGAFSNTDPNSLVFGSEDGSIFTYNQNINQKVHHHQKLPGPIQNLEFSSDDQTIAFGCGDGQIFLCDSNYKICTSLMIPSSPTLSAISYSKLTPHLLAAGSKDGVLALWDTETTDCIISMKNHNGRMTDLTFYQNLLLTVGTDGKFFSYDLRSSKRHAFHDFDVSLSSVACLPGFYELAIATQSGQLRSYDIRNMKSPLRTLVAYVNGGIKKIAFPYRVEEASNFTKAYEYTNKAYDEDFSASGDFSIESSSSSKHFGTFDKQKSHQDELAGSSPRKCPTKPTELDHLEKLLEDKIRASTKDFEERLIQAFYGLRINTSKQMIGLEEKIAQTWDDFLQYLHASGTGHERSNDESSTTDENYSFISVRKNDEIPK